MQLKDVQLYRWHPPSYQEYREEVVLERQRAAGPGVFVRTEPTEAAVIEEMAQALLLADPQLEHSAAVKTATLARQAAVEKDYKERLSTCGAVRMAQFLFKVYRIRQRKLRSLGVCEGEEDAIDARRSGSEPEEGDSDEISENLDSQMGARRNLFGTGG